MKRTVKHIVCIVSTLQLLGCNQIDFTKLTLNTFSSAASQMPPSSVENSSEKTLPRRNLAEIIATAQPNLELDGDFSSLLKLAVQSDPRVLSARQDYEIRLSSIAFLSTIFFLTAFEIIEYSPET